MEARRFGAIGFILLCLASVGASSQTRNFIVHTADPHHAVAFAQQAERLRRELAIAWLGQVLPDWSYPCPITATVGPHLGAGGATSFVFDRGEVYGWRMTIQGSYERILDSVLPHEITHMIFASYFRRPLPRWADEGGATTVEHETEKAKYRRMLIQFLRSHRGIPFDRMFSMTEYPADIMPLYAQAYALAEYLIQQGGRRKYVDFLAEGIHTGRWTEALQKHYGIRDLQTLQNHWVAWVAQGFPPLPSAPERMLAAAGSGPVPLGAPAHPSPSGFVSAGATPTGASAQDAPVGRSARGAPAGVSTHGVSAAVSARGTPTTPGQPTGLLSAAPGASAPPGASEMGRNGPSHDPGSSIQLASASSGWSPSASQAPWAAFAPQAGSYRPGSTARPGIIWTLPLIPLPESACQANSLAQDGAPASTGGDQTGPSSLRVRGQDSFVRESGSPAEAGSGTVAQTRSALPGTSGRSGEVGAEGWLPAGSRPLFAPGSVGRALAQAPAFLPLPSSGAVDSQHARPQMPQSVPGSGRPWPNTALR